ncbi:MAG TPA: RsmE family RNA methyltransferase [Candidatus Peribacterales bacterium]|nr:RsmE family RNA methyltransferase [Candidatus Peribacterales bacterium]
MRLHRFLIDQALTNGSLRITEKDLLHQWQHVLRLKAGDSVILLDGQDHEADAVIESINPTSASLIISHLRDVTSEPKRHVRLYCAVLQRGNMELVVQKATEVGVKEIVPIITARTVKTGLKMERFQKIMREAVEQCGRGVMPVLSEPTDFTHALQTSALLPLNIFFHVGEEDVSWIDRVKKSSHVSVWVGPEGGWTDEEVSAAQKRGFLIGSLGSLALRAETAAITAAHLASFL